MADSGRLHMLERPEVQPEDSVEAVVAAAEEEAEGDMVVATACKPQFYR